MLPPDCTATLRTNLPTCAFMEERQSIPNVTQLLLWFCGPLKLICWTPSSMCPLQDTQQMPQVVLSPVSFHLKRNTVQSLFGISKSPASLLLHFGVITKEISMCYLDRSSASLNSQPHDQETPEDRSQKLLISLIANIFLSLCCFRSRWCPTLQNT